MEEEGEIKRLVEDILMKIVSKEEKGEKREVRMEEEAAKNEVNDEDGSSSLSSGQSTPRSPPQGRSQSHTTPISVSLLILAQVHLGRRNWCTYNGGKFLVFCIDVFSSELAYFREMKKNREQLRKRRKDDEEREEDEDEEEAHEDDNSTAHLGVIIKEIKDALQQCFFCIQSSSETA